MELITEFRSRSMKVVVTILDKKLWKGLQQVSDRSQFKTKDHVRHSEVDQPIMEQELHDLRVTSAVVQLPRRQCQNNKVEAHGIDEHCGQDLGVGRDDDAAATRYPLCLDDHALRQRGLSR